MQTPQTVEIFHSLRCFFWLMGVFKGVHLFYRFKNRMLRSTSSRAPGDHRSCIGNACHRAYFGGCGLCQIMHKLLLQQAGALGFMLDPVNNFIAGGVASTLMTWMVQGYREEPEEMAQLLTGYITRLAPEKSEAFSPQP